MADAASEDARQLLQRQQQRLERGRRRSKSGSGRKQRTTSASSVGNRSRNSQPREQQPRLRRRLRPSCNDASSIATPASVGASIFSAPADCHDAKSVSGATARTEDTGNTAGTAKTAPASLTYGKSRKIRRAGSASKSGFASKSTTKKRMERPSRNRSVPKPPPPSQVNPENFPQRLVEKTRQAVKSRSKSKSKSRSSKKTKDASSKSAVPSKPDISPSPSPRPNRHSLSDRRKASAVVPRTSATAKTNAVVRTSPTSSSSSSPVPVPVPVPVPLATSPGNRIRNYAHHYQQQHRNMRHPCCYYYDREHQDNQNGKEGEDEDSPCYSPTAPPSVFSSTSTVSTSKPDTSVSVANSSVTATTVSSYSTANSSIDSLSDRQYPPAQAANANVQRPFVHSHPSQEHCRGHRRRDLPSLASSSIRSQQRPKSHSPRRHASAIVSPTQYNRTHPFQQSQYPRSNSVDDNHILLQRHRQQQLQQQQQHTTAMPSVAPPFHQGHPSTNEVLSIAGRSYQPSLPISAPPLAVPNAAQLYQQQQHQEHYQMQRQQQYQIQRQQQQQQQQQYERLRMLQKQQEYQTAQLQRLHPQLQLRFQSQRIEQTQQQIQQVRQKQQLAGPRSAQQQRQRSASTHLEQPQQHRFNNTYGDHSLSPGAYRGRRDNQRPSRSVSQDVPPASFQSSTFNHYDHHQQQQQQQQMRYSHEQEQYLNDIDYPDDHSEEQLQHVQLPPPPQPLQAAMRRSAVQNHPQPPMHDDNDDVRQRRAVRFSIMQVYEHPTTVGVEPVSNGPALTMEWEMSHCWRITVDDFQLMYRRHHQKNTQSNDSTLQRPRPQRNRGPNQQSNASEATARVDDQFSIYSDGYRPLTAVERYQRLTDNGVPFASIQSCMLQSRFVAQQRLETQLKVSIEDLQNRQQQQQQQGAVMIQ